LLSGCASGRSRHPSLTFDELYGKVGVLGLEFSDKVKSLAGRNNHARASWRRR
jgi:hypothetical protein